MWGRGISISQYLESVKSNASITDYLPESVDSDQGMMLKIPGSLNGKIIHYIYTGWGKSRFIVVST